MLTQLIVYLTQEPFRFLVGYQTIEENKKAIKPLAPFTKDYQRIVYEYFIDYETGERKKGVHYFKPLSRTISQYAEHPEHKFEGDVGILLRRHLKPKCCVYIGKEANKVEMQELEGNTVETYLDITKFHEWVLSLKPEDARAMGIKDRSTLKRIKDKISQGKKLNYKHGAVKVLVENYQYFLH